MKKQVSCKLQRIRNSLKRFAECICHRQKCQHFLRGLFSEKQAKQGEYQFADSSGFMVKNGVNKRPGSFKGKVNTIPYEESTQTYIFGPPGFGENKKYGSMKDFFFRLSSEKNRKKLRRMIQCCE